MSAMVSQITDVSIVYSNVCSGADQIKHQSSASLALVRVIHRWPVNSPHKGPVTRKMFPFYDVIMWLIKKGPLILSPGDALVWRASSPASLPWGNGDGIVSNWLQSRRIDTFTSWDCFTTVLSSNPKVMKICVYHDLYFVWLRMSKCFEWYGYCIRECRRKKSEEKVEVTFRPAFPLPSRICSWNAIWNIVL